MPKPRKFRADLRKNRSSRRRSGNLTRAAAEDPDGVADLASSERLSGKGDLTRRRTVVLDGGTIDGGTIDGGTIDGGTIGGGATRIAAGASIADGGAADGSAADGGAADGSAADGGAANGKAAATWRGRVLHVHGLESVVQADDGRTARCTLRRLLRTLSTDERHPVAAGDMVRVRDDAGSSVIQSVEPRRTAICRASRRRRHVIVANVDQAVIVGSAAMPDLKPGLVDRFLVAVESAGIRPIICINKIDLVDPALLVPLAGVYARMGYETILCSAVTGQGIPRLRRELAGRVTAVVGQSGVGKSSLFNAIDPSLALPVAAVSRDNDKGRHTTTTARLIPHGLGGALVDTPGIRQFKLWSLVPAEVPAAFRDLRPLANLCRFPDCGHTHETGCAVKDAVADGLLDTRRWESCGHLSTGDDDRGGKADDDDDDIFTPLRPAGAGAAGAGASDGDDDDPEPA